MSKRKIKKSLLRIERIIRKSKFDCLAVAKTMERIREIREILGIQEHT